MTPAWRIVKIRDATGSDASEDVRIIRLPGLIVTSANYRIGECMENPRPNRPVSLVEVTGILFEQGRQDRAFDTCTGGCVGIRCTKALRIPARALAISREGIRSLFNSRKCRYSDECEGIR